MSGAPVFESPAAAFAQAVKVIGSQVAVAKLLGMTQGAVSKRIRKGMDCWPEHVLTIERESGIPKEQLRPDLFRGEPRRDPDPTAYEHAR